MLRTALVFVLSLPLLAVAQPARAQAFEQRLRDSVERFVENAEAAIMYGGIVLQRHRHAVAGTAVGCLAGSAAGAGGAVALGVASGGLALAGTPQAAAIGCAAGGLAGAAIGNRLDRGPG